MVASKGIEEMHMEACCIEVPSLATHTHVFVMLVILVTVILVTVILVTVILVTLARPNRRGARRGSGARQQTC